MPRQPGNPSVVAYHCQACRHLSGGAYKVWTLACSVARNSGIFFAGVPDVAAYFGVHKATAYRWLAEAEEAGFLICVERGDYSTKTPSKFRPIFSHKEWAAAHPGQCSTKREGPASGKEDPLISGLWAVSGGRCRFFPSQLKALRTLTASDTAIEEEFVRFWFVLGESPDKATCRKASGLFVWWLQLSPEDRDARLERAKSIERDRLALAHHLAATVPGASRRLALGARQPSGSTPGRLPEDSQMSQKCERETSQSVA